MPNDNIANLFLFAFCYIQNFQKAILITNKTRPSTTNRLRIQFRMNIKQNGMIVRPSKSLAILTTKIVSNSPLAQIVPQPLNKQLRVALT